MDPEQLKQRIRRRLVDLSIPQAEVARRASWPPNFLSDLLHGRKNSVRPDNLRRLAAALETTTDYLRGTTEDPSVTSPIAKGYSISPAKGLGLVALPFHSRPVLNRELLMAWRDRQPDQGAGRVPFFVNRHGSLPGAVGFDAGLPDATATVPAIAGLQGGYAILMPDDCMKPAIPAGWGVYAAPRAVTPDSIVVVQTSVERRTVFLVRLLVTFDEEEVVISTLAEGSLEILTRGSFHSAHPVVALMTGPEIL